MKKLKQGKKAPDTGGPQKSNLHLIEWGILLLFPFYLWFILESLYFQDLHALSILITTRFHVVIDGLGMLTVLSLAVLFIVRKVWIGIGILSLTAFLLAVGNYYKILHKGIPLLPWDLSLIPNLGDLVKFGGLETSGWELSVPIVLCGLSVVVITGFFIWAGTTIKLRLHYTVSVLALLCFLLASFFTSEAVQARMLPEGNEGLAEHANPLEFYSQNGFVGAFSANLWLALTDKPEIYDFAETKRQLASYKQIYPLSDQETAAVYPDIVFILSESYFDITQLSHVTFNKDPLTNFRDYAGQGISGGLLVPTLGGGTVRTEFEVLSGLAAAYLPIEAYPYDQYINRPTPTLASYLKNLGYETRGLHTYERSFYNRDEAYPWMGFDSFYGKEDLNPELPYSGNYISDAAFSDEIILQLASRQAADPPLFLMGISMQNHGPYIGSYEQIEGFTYSIEVESDCLDDSFLTMVQNCTQGIHDADQALGKLLQYAEGCERPTLIVFFGDHLPYLGNPYDVYQVTGFIDNTDSNTWNEEEMQRMYTTPYLIFSNFEKDKLPAGEGLSGKTADTYPYFLPAEVLQYLEFPLDPFWSFLCEYDRAGMQAGKTSAGGDYNQLHSYLTYDRVRGERYSNLPL